MISALEEKFPHAIHRLHECWGDPEYFGLVFADLTLDRRGNRHGWPEDAWMDLVFLEEIHDLAYGIARTRSGNAVTRVARDPLSTREGYNWIYGD
ncbi:hypothetical protein [Thiocystis violacea]|uniref:hypothetical protein n=1 Tax=Thiocystis violacea TaxID=13725 RepID=UPI0019073416|nr:hypothetical protein [Thiocystis violacea]MBK1718281.1 hypothetical protein [Thiocystis violacea]